MKKDVLTKYLAVFLLLCLVLDGILGAFYCHLMKKNVDEHPNKLTWLLVYKGIKLVLTIAILVLYILFVKESSKVFVIITASTYLIALVTETWVYNHYIKNLNKEDKA